MNTTSPNMAHLATVLRTSAQIQPHGWTSDTLGMLSKFAPLIENTHPTSVALTTSTRPIARGYPKFHSGVAWMGFGYTVG